MARKKRKNREKRECVYCGNIAICTREHVIPECLYPESNFPAKSQFVIVPVCSPCNNRKARDDSYVRDVLTSHISCNGNPTVRAVLPAVWRSMAKNWSDFGRTAANQIRMKEMRTPAGIYLGHYSSVPLDWKRVERFLCLVTRGLYWKKFGKRLPELYDFDVRRLCRADGLKILRTMIEFGGDRSFVIGEGVFGCFFVTAPDDQFFTNWLLMFYESIFFIITTAPREFLKQLDS
jgi:hypothetical protein